MHELFCVTSCMHCGGFGAKEVSKKAKCNDPVVSRECSGVELKSG